MQKYMYKILYNLYDKTKNNKEKLNFIFVPFANV